MKDAKNLIVEFKNNVRKLIEIKEFTKALTLLEEIDIEDIEIYNMKACIYIYTEKLEKAELVLKKSLSIDNKNFDTLFNLANVYQKMLNYDNAINYYEKCMNNALNYSDYELVENIIESIKLEIGHEYLIEERVAILIDCDHKVLKSLNINVNEIIKINKNTNIKHTQKKIEKNICIYECNTEEYQNTIEYLVRNNNKTTILCKNIKYVEELMKFGINAEIILIEEENSKIILKHDLLNNLEYIATNNIENYLYKKIVYQISNIVLFDINNNKENEYQNLLYKISKQDEDYEQYIYDLYKNYNNDISNKLYIKYLFDCKQYNKLIETIVKSMEVCNTYIYQLLFLLENNEYDKFEKIIKLILEDFNYVYKNINTLEDVAQLYFLEKQYDKSYKNYVDIEIQHDIQSYSPLRNRNVAFCMYIKRDKKYKIFYKKYIEQRKKYNEILKDNYKLDEKIVKDEIDLICDIFENSNIELNGDEINKIFNSISYVYKQKMTKNYIKQKFILNKNIENLIQRDIEVLIAIEDANMYNSLNHIYKASTHIVIDGQRAINLYDYNKNEIEPMFRIQRNLFIVKTIEDLKKAENIIKEKYIGDYNDLYLTCALYIDNDILNLFNEIHYETKFNQKSLKEWWLKNLDINGITDYEVYTDVYMEFDNKYANVYNAINNNYLDKYIYQDTHEESNMYGASSTLKKYAKTYKNNNIYIEHGLFLTDFVQQYALDSNTPAAITFSKYREEMIRKKTIKPIIKIGPYIHYAKNIYDEKFMDKIKKIIGRTLLVFTSHSSFEFNVEVESKKIIEQIEEIKINKKFDTVLVCMHWRDKLLDRHKLYEELGFKVVSCGYGMDDNFLNRLKTIINLSDYTISTGFGTHIGYCTYMKKPHTVIGEHAYIKGECKNNIIDESYEISKLYKEYTEFITEEQMEICNTYWGFEFTKSKEDLSFILNFYSKLNVALENKNEQAINISEKNEIYLQNFKNAMLELDEEKKKLIKDCI